MHNQASLITIISGYYADPEAECQAFHICTSDAEGGLAKYSFLCPNGTIFNQEYFICDWWFNVDCSEAEALAAERNAALESAREEADARFVVVVVVVASYLITKLSFCRRTRWSSALYHHCITCWHW